MQTSLTKWRVLVFPGGTEIGLEVGRALASCKEVELFSAGLPNSAPAICHFRKHAGLVRPSLRSELFPQKALDTL